MATTVHTCLPIIGGAEDTVGRATVLRRVVQLAGGPGGRIVAIPSASSLPMRRCKTYSTERRELASAGSQVRRCLADSTGAAEHDNVGSTKTS